MKSRSKFVLIMVLVALLTAAFATTAFAGTRVVRPAVIEKVKLISNQPVTVRLLGYYTCDKAQTSYSVNGKTISIYISDIKVKHTGNGCDQKIGFRKDVAISEPMVPGTYTILINPDGNGKAQKKIKDVVVPLLPTATPSAAPKK